MSWASRIFQPGWDNDGEPGNQVPTKSAISGNFFCIGPAVAQDMYKYDCIWFEKDQINNCYDIMDNTSELNPFKVGLIQQLYFFKTSQIPYGLLINVMFPSCK